MGATGDISVIAVSPKSAVRQRLRDVLRQAWDLRLVGLASDDDSGAELVKSLHPDVALWDPCVKVALHDGDALPAPLAYATERTRVLLCGSANDARHAVAAATLGFWGFIAADQNGGQLISAVRSVVRGELWIGRKTLSEAFLELMRVNSAQRHDSSSLSARENQIATYVSRGLTNKEIAKRLEISDTTVKTHVHRILQKLHLRNRVLLAMAETGTAAAMNTKVDQVLGGPADVRYGH
jgi:DNA-binding NarL/FixJ family response regulator